MENKIEKKEPTIGILAAKLLVITAVAGLILGYVYNITKDSIARQDQLTNENAMKTLLTSADSFTEDKDKTGDGIEAVNVAKKGSETVGYAIKVKTKGYGGTIELMVGIDTNDKITGIQILSQGETAGLGANCTQESFYGQFAGKSTEKDLEVIKTDGADDSQVKAITGATITSRGVTSGVNNAVKFYKENLKGGK